ncbi:MAG: flagellar filament capping protein FliD [Caldimonas sp.]
MNITPTTGTISSAGIGSGLDVNDIITKLMATEQKPLVNLQTAASAMQTKLSAFGQMQSYVSALQDAATSLFSSTTYTATKTSSSNTSSVNASSSATAMAGTYSVSVSALSAPQSIVSATGQFTDGSSPVGTGSITIQLAKTGSTAITIPIGASDNTLAAIRDKINAATTGVTATLVTDVSGTRIALQSSAPGLDNAFTVTVAEDAGSPGLARLAYDPVVATSPMLLAQSAANAQAKVNGIDVSSSNNTLAGVVDGMTFTLSQVTTTPVSVSVTSDTDSIKAQLTNFVASYNQLNSFIAATTKYDPTTKTAALLQGDSTTVGIQNQLQSLLGQTSGASSAFRTLSSIGLQIQKDGTLELDDATVTAALANLPELTKAMSNVDLTNPSNNGFAKKFSAWTTNLLASNGTLPGKAASIQRQIASNQKDQDAMNARLEQIQARMQAQYTALDSTMAKANALSAYVTQQIATWNKQKDY